MRPGPAAVTFGTSSLEQAAARYLHAEQRCGSLRSALEQTRGRAAALPPLAVASQARERREIRRLGRELRQAESDYSDVLENGDLHERLAGRVIGHHYALLRERSSTRHAYHPEVLDDVAELSHEVLAAASGKGAMAMLDPLTRPGSPHGWRSAHLAGVPGLAAHLTLPAIEAHIRAGVQHHARVAADERMLIERHDQGLVIQHVASGLRAAFTGTERPRPDSAGEFGSVFSKPYKIPSIDPDRPGALRNWEAYVGLGIGRRIYQVAAAELPEIRWRGSGITSSYASGLRRRLHAQDPYRWQAGGCGWCRERLEVDWDRADRAQLADHPRQTSASATPSSLHP